MLNGLIIYMGQEEIEDIIERYFKGLTNPDEERNLNSWYRRKVITNANDLDISDKVLSRLKAQMLQELLHSIRSESKQQQMDFKDQKRNEFRSATAGLIKNLSWKTWGCVAVSLVLFYFSILVYRLHFLNRSDNQQIREHETATITARNIHGVRSGAVLHLSNGKTLSLDSLSNGVVAEQNGVKILKSKNGLVYVGKAKQTLYNDVTTARGQQWSLTLSDGTKVKLNAGSSIHYPLTFNGSERLVRITGEAYFDVVHNQSRPFIVEAGGTRIEDIGTRFNVNAYRDEPVIKTTLLHGSVKVSTGSSSQILIPGQQARTDATHLISVSKVNTDNETGWINGEIIFDNEALEEVMKKVSRWYDIDVTYEGKIPKRKFVGSISSQLSLSEFLKLLAFENVPYKLNNKQLTILP